MRDHATDQFIVEDRQSCPEHFKELEVPMTGYRKIFKGEVQTQSRYVMPMERLWDSTNHDKTD